MSTGTVDNSVDKLWVIGGLACGLLEDNPVDILYISLWITLCINCVHFAG